MARALQWTTRRYGKLFRWVGIFMELLLPESGIYLTNLSNGHLIAGFTTFIMFL
jgi:hypothetical protein